MILRIVDQRNRQLCQKRQSVVIELSTRINFSFYSLIRYYNLVFKF